MRLRIVFALLSLVLFSTLSAFLVAGHIWRIPTSLMSLVDANFVLSIAFVFGQEILIAFAVLKLVSLTCDLFLSKPKEIRLFEEIRFALYFCIYVVGLFLAAFTFMVRYLGMSVLEGNLAVFLILGLIGVAFFASDQFFANLIRTLHASGVDGSAAPLRIEDALRAVIVTPMFGFAFTCGILASLVCGELRMANLLDEKNALQHFVDNDLSGRPEIRNIIGPMSDGILYAFYRGPKYSNQKDIIFFHVSNNGGGTRQARSISRIGALVGLPQ